MTYRPSRSADFPDFALFNDHDWGLIVYDEVHLLPAPRVPHHRRNSGPPATRLTATLIREDGRQTDVLSLIGPKKQDVPWTDLERQGRIATATCHEVRVRLPEDQRIDYALADETEKYRVAAENPAKLAVLERLVAEHADDQVLIIGQYLNQLHHVAERRGRRCSPVRGRRASGNSFTRPFGGERCADWWCPKWPTSRSTCRTRALELRIAAVGITPIGITFRPVT